jgi:hypothetical protein
VSAHRAQSTPRLMRELKNSMVSIKDVVGLF